MFAFGNHEFRLLVLTELANRNGSVAIIRFIYKHCNDGVGKILINILPISFYWLLLYLFLLLNYNRWQVLKAFKGENTYPPLRIAKTYVL